jgi:pyridoxal phosphate enzyme (YggS family)
MESWRGGIEANLRDVRARLDQAAARAGRDPGLVRLMAVTKTVPVERIQHAVDLGLELLGENRVQEAKEKLPLLKGEFAMHLIGHLQSNKAGVAADLFASVDSVDSVELAGRLSRLALERGRRLPVLLEVNTSGEPAKFGFEAAELEAASADWASLPGLEVRGLMTLGPVPESGRDPRPCFAALRALRDRLQDRLSRPFPELSMGMSGDFECGVEEGSTLIRVGSALFGPRRA